VELGRERLAGDERGPSILYRCDLRIAIQAKDDPVAYVEPRGLAGILDDAHEFAREPFALEIRCEPELERDGHAGLRRDAPSRERVPDELDVGRRDLDDRSDRKSVV